jgi:hypothetical protein
MGPLGVKVVPGSLVLLFKTRLKHILHVRQQGEIMRKQSKQVLVLSGLLILLGSVIYGAVKITERINALEHAIREHVLNENYLSKPLEWSSVQQKPVKVFNKSDR